MWTLIASVLTIANMANADIIFIDVNNSYDEVATAQKEAAARHEKLIILPNPDRPLAVQIRALRDQIKHTDKEYNKLNCYGQMLCSGKFTTKTCESISEKSRGQNMKMQDMTKGKLNADTVSAGIQQVYTSGRSVSSVIVSGEDGGSVFGTYGTVKYDDLDKAFAKVPQLKTDVQALYLWGCYMGTSGRIDHAWTKMFPGAKLMIGFHDSGPADGSPPSLQLMGKAMRSERKAFASYTKDATARFFRSIPEVHQMNTSMCINGRYLDSENNISLSELESLGEACVKNFPHELHKKFVCYYNAEAGCASPPKEHQEGALREYYSYLRKNEICLNNPVFYRAIPDAGKPDSAMRLIYYDRIWDNFLRVYGADMKRLNSLFHAVGLGSEVDFKGGPSMSRREFMDWFSKAEERLSTKDDEKSKYIKSAMSAIYNGVVDLNAWRIPESWITGSSSEKGHYPMNVEAKCEESN